MTTMPGHSISWDLIRVQAIAGMGYSGGPLFPLDGNYGYPPNSVSETSETEIKNAVIGICIGEYVHFPDETCFSSIALFNQV